MRILRVLSYSVVIFFGLFNNNLKAQRQDSIELKIKKSIDKSLSMGVLPNKLKGIQLAASSMFIVLDSDARVEKVLISESLVNVFEAREKITSLLKTHINNVALDKSSYANSYFMVVIMIVSLNETTVPLAKLPENWENLFKGIDTNQLNGKTLKYYYPSKMEIFSIK